MTINRIDAIDPGSYFDKIFEIVSDYNIINYSPKSKNSQITGDASGRLLPEKQRGQVQDQKSTGLLQRQQCGAQ
jgi:hypothetical protein